jgi:hypothetical protein
MRAKQINLSVFSFKVMCEAYPTNDNPYFILNYFICFYGYHYSNRKLNDIVLFQLVIQPIFETN